MKLTQSVAILRHLGRKHGLTAPNDNEELQRRVNLAEMEAYDLQRAIGKLCYTTDGDDKARLNFLTDNAAKMRQFEAFLTKGGGPFVLGDKVTYVDFLLYEALDVFRILGPSAFKRDYPRLVEYLSSVAALPGVREYLASSRFKAWPIAAPIAKMGGPQHSPPS